MGETFKGGVYCNGKGFLMKGKPDLQAIFEKL